MPSVLIEVRRTYTPNEESAIMEAVHAALQSCFKIKPSDRHVRLIAHPPHRFMCPPEREKPDYVTHVSIDCIAGRSLDAKRCLYQTIVKNLQPLGIPPSHVKIMLREITQENWGIRGGYAACDVELGHYPMREKKLGLHSAAILETQCMNIRSISARRRNGNQRICQYFTQ